MLSNIEAVKVRDSNGAYKAGKASKDARHIALATNSAEGPLVLVRATVWHSASYLTCRAIVWVESHGPEGKTRAVGHGSANGGGYHKESAALYYAVTGAGYDLTAENSNGKREPFYFDGTGTTYYLDVFTALAKAAGHKGPFSLIEV